MNFKNILNLKIFNRYYSNSISKKYSNRNPRNLELMRIGYKPHGYFLEKPGFNRFWNKLEIIPSGKHLTVQVIHFEFGPFVQVSTREWAIQKHLYKTTDTSSYINSARILADRLNACGIKHISCDINPKSGTKIDYFLNTLKNEGIILEEPEQFKPYTSGDLTRPPKPWEADYFK